MDRPTIWAEAVMKYKRKLILVSEKHTAFNRIRVDNSIKVRGQAY